MRSPLTIGTKPPASSSNRMILSSPAHADRYGEKTGLNVAVVRLMVADFDKQLGIAEMVCAIGDPAAIVVAAGNFGVRGERLWKRDGAVEARKVPPCPRGLAERSRGQQLVARRNGSVIKTNAENSVGSPVADMPRHVYDAVDAERLHVPALAWQALAFNHARLEAEVVIHVFAIHAEYAVEVPPRADDAIKRGSHKLGDIAAADSDSRACGKVIVAKT
jgi:hypothetical protein